MKNLRHPRHLRLKNVPTNTQTLKHSNTQTLKKLTNYENQQRNLEDDSEGRWCRHCRHYQRAGGAGDEQTLKRIGTGTMQT